MSTADLDRALRESIEDLRLSRSERKALRELVQDHIGDAHRAALLRSRAFAVAHDAAADTAARDVVAWLQDVVSLIEHHGRGDEPAAAEARAWFSPGTDCLEAVVEQLRMVRTSADICVFTITDDRITKAIMAAAARRVRVRVLSDDEKSEDRGSDLDRLERAHIPVARDRSPDHMHHKFALFDGVRLLTGSFNWTRSASRGNHENLLLTTDARLVAAYQAEFDGLWERYG